MPVLDHLRAHRQNEDDVSRENNSSRAKMLPSSSSASTFSPPSWESLPPALRMSTMKQEAKRLSSAKKNASEEASMVSSAIQQRRKVVRKVRKKKKKKKKKATASEMQQAQDSANDAAKHINPSKNLAWARRRHHLVKANETCTGNGEGNSDCGSDGDSDSDSDSDSQAGKDEHVIVSQPSSRRRSIDTATENSQSEGFETQNERYARPKKEQEERRQREHSSVATVAVKQQKEHVPSMQDEANAMRKRLAAMGITVKSPKTPKSATPHRQVVKTNEPPIKHGQHNSHIPNETGHGSSNENDHLNEEGWAKVVANNRPSPLRTSREATVTLPATTLLNNEASNDDGGKNVNDSDAQKSIVGSQQPATLKHSYKLIQKKLKKVKQLLSEATPKSKQHKKYQQKKAEYEKKLKDMEQQQQLEQPEKKTSKKDAPTKLSVTSQPDPVNKNTSRALPGEKAHASAANGGDEDNGSSNDGGKDWIAKAREQAIRKEKDRLERQKNLDQDRQRRSRQNDDHKERNCQRQEERGVGTQQSVDEKKTRCTSKQEGGNNEHYWHGNQEQAERERVETTNVQQHAEEEEKPQQELCRHKARHQEPLRQQHAEQHEGDDMQPMIPNRPTGGIFGGGDLQAELQRKAKEKERKALERQRREQEENERKQLAADKKRRTQDQQGQRVQEVLVKDANPAPGKSVRETLTAEELEMGSTQRLLRAIEKSEKKQRKIEKQLQQNGIPVSEDIPYDMAKSKIEQIQVDMRALMAESDGSFAFQNKYYKLEEELAKYSTALMLTDEYQAEQQRLEQEWETKHAPANIEALHKLRRHMPVSIRIQSEDSLVSTPTPNGKHLPKALVRKFKRTNVLQLLRLDPDAAIEKMHPSLLEGMRTTGLTLTERRALHEHLKNMGAIWQSLRTDPSMEKKWMWFSALKSKFKEELHKYDEHVREYGPPGSHPYANRKDPSAGGCPLIGNQCPLKADAVVSYDGDYGFTTDAVFETTETARSTLASGDSTSGDTGGTTSLQRQQSFGSLRKNVARRGNYANAATQAININDIIETIRNRLQLPAAMSVREEKLLKEAAQSERRAKMLEKQLVQAGFKVAEDDISYVDAKANISSLTDEIKDVAAEMGATSDSKRQAQLEAKYVRLVEELEKYNAAIMLTKEWEQEQRDKQRLWEESIRPANEQALKDIRRHMPVNIRDLSEDEMTNALTPNGKKLPAAMVKKFKRTNVLMLLRLDPRQIEPMHPSSLEGLRTTGLTLTERRALYEHLKDLGDKWRCQTRDKMVERKWMWHESLKGKYREVLEKYEKHVQQYGTPDNHPYAKKRGDGGCPMLGNQCPVKADAAMDYSGDYGYPESAEYSMSEVQKSNLLTVEEFQARQRAEQDESNDADADGDETSSAKKALGGMLKQIFAAGP